MPYYRRRYRRRPYRRRYRRRAYRKTSRLQKLADDKSASGWSVGSVAQAAYKALSIANTVAGLINVEWKENDNELSVVNQTTTPQLIRLTDIAQGLDDNQRIGNGILMKSLQMKIKASKSTAEPQNGILKFWLVCDKDADGVDPTFAQIFKDPTAPADRIIALRNEDLMSRFVIIKEWKMVFKTDDTVKEMNIYEKLNIHCKYDASAAGTANARENQLWLVMVSDQATYGNVVSIQKRLRYTDN